MQTQTRDHGGLDCRWGFLHLSTMTPGTRQLLVVGTVLGTVRGEQHPGPYPLGASGVLPNVARGTISPGRTAALGGSGQCWWGAAERTLMCSGGGMAGSAEELTMEDERKDSRKMCIIT